MRTVITYFDKNGELVPEPLAKQYAIKAVRDVFDDRGLMTEHETLFFEGEKEPAPKDEEE